MRIFPAMLAAIVALGALAMQPTSLGADSSVKVLFDFGDGTYLWTEVDVGLNRTAFNMTVRASDASGLNLTYRWFSFGVMVQDIGDRHPSYPLWWHLFQWTDSGSRWEISQLGAAELNLSAGDIIAWYLAVDNPDTLVNTRPVPSPLHPYPYISFRKDVSNSGHYSGSLCGDHSLRWQFDTQAFEISGTPAAAYGRLLVPTWAGFFILDADSGAPVRERSDISGMSSPAVFNGGALVGGRDGYLHYIDASNGTDIWSTRLVPSPIFTGIASSPKQYMDRVYVGLFNESGGDGGIVAVNVWNGTIVWKHVSPSIHLSTPAIRDDTLYVGVAGHFDGLSYSFNPPYGLLALNISDGSERWFMPTAGSVASSPVVVGSLVFFTSRDGTVHAARSNGTEAWTYAIGNSTSSPATDGSRLFVADGIMGQKGTVIALSKTGQKLWETTLSGPVQSSLLYVDGAVLATTNEAYGTLYVLDANSGDPLWTYMPVPANYTISSPIVADGIVYMASDNGFVYALGCPSEVGNEGPSALTYAILVIVPLVVVAVIAGGFYLVRRRER
jgi:outer membrane protein assembly factor BamB